MHTLSLKNFHLKIIVLFVSLAFLSGCGFHVKHNDGLVEKFPKIYLQSSDPNGELARFVKIRLRGAGIELATLADADTATLKIEAEQRTSRVVSLYVNAQNAETELGYVVRYSLQSPGYQAQSFRVNLYRDFLDNPSQALAKSREAEQLTTELRAVAAEHILNSMITMEHEVNKTQ
ncbi:MAG: LPS assembly lipoprotein LptE [Psychromonas sp.]